MGKSRRTLLRALPLAALAPAAIAKIEERKARGYEVRPNKRYVFKIPSDVGVSTKEMEGMRDLLQQRGIDATIIHGEIEIYEMG